LREKQFVDDIEVATRVHESLRNAPLPFWQTRPVATRRDDPETLGLDRMRLIFL
jgi:hypothetical protein